MFCVPPAFSVSQPHLLPVPMNLPSHLCPAAPAALAAKTPRSKATALMSKVQASPTFRAGFASDEVFDSTVAEVCVLEDNHPTALASTPLVC
jgi:hypothetical protein